MHLRIWTSTFLANGDNYCLLRQVPLPGAVYVQVDTGCVGNGGLNGIILKGLTANTQIVQIM